MTRSRGFTLLEVMVALAVVAIALGAIIKGVSNQTAAAAYLRDRTLAHFVAMNRVAELQLAKSWPGAGTSRGTAELAKREWRWQARVQETPDPTVRKVEVEVTPVSDERQVLDRITAFLPKPPAPPAPQSRPGLKP